jgi:hypothetical protein
VFRCESWQHKHGQGDNEEKAQEYMLSTWDLLEPCERAVLRQRRGELVGAGGTDVVEHEAAIFKEQRARAEKKKRKKKKR